MVSEGSPERGGRGPGGRGGGSNGCLNAKAETKGLWKGQGDVKKSKRNCNAERYEGVKG